jgi:hypothetical protein
VRTQTAALPTKEGSARPAEARVRPDIYQFAVWGIVLAQAAFLGVLMTRGWFYQSDFANLAAATGRPLSISYLTLPQGGHLAVGDKIVYWLLNRTAPLNHGLTIALRLVLQAATTLFLARLLEILVGRRPGVLVTLLFYAFTPLLIQTQLWLTASIAFLPSQLLVLAAYYSHIRYAASHRLTWAAGTALALFAAASFSEQSAVAALGLPLLTFGYLSSGGWRARLRETARRWPEWAMITAPILLFAAYFFASRRYVGEFGVGLGFADALRLLGDEFRLAVMPGMVGGPLDWFSGPTNALSIAVPANWVQIVAGAAVLVLVAVSVRRTSWWALLAWSIPLLIIAVGTIVVGLGRFRGLGLVVARQYEHTGYVAIPLAIAVCLAMWADRPEDVFRRLHRAAGTVPASPSAGATAPRRRPVARHPAARRVVVGCTGLALVGVLTASVVSSIGYSSNWAHNPARPYVDNLETELRRAGPDVALYDTPVDGSVIPSIEPQHHVSDLVALLGLHARFDGVGSDLRVVKPNGRLAEADMLVPARGVQAKRPGCAVIAHGVGTWRIPLNRVPHPGEYFLQLSYLQPNPSVISVRVLARSGRLLAPSAGSRVALPGQLNTFTARLPWVSPAAVIIGSRSLATNVCISDVVIAVIYPVVKK